MRTIHRAVASLAAAALSAAALGSMAAPAQAAGTDELLTTGERIERGGSLVSPSGRYRLELDDTGALRLTERGSWLNGDEPVNWKNFAFRVQFVTLQSDGNLVATTEDGEVRSVSGTSGSGATALRLQDDRNLVFTGSGGQVVADLASSEHTAFYAGAFLLPGDRVPGEDRGSVLVMQTDGNLVLYRGATPLWSSGTQGSPGAGAVLQTDGNLVVYSPPESGRRALFWTGALIDPEPVYYESPVLVVEDREVSVRVQFEGGIPTQSFWGSNWASDRIQPGDELDRGDRRTSRDGRCTLVMQDDDNLVEYCGGRAVFATGHQTLDIPDFTTAVMQADGNFVVYATDHLGDGSPLIAGFNTGTTVPDSSLVVQDDGNVVVQAPNGTPTWSRLTGRLR